MITLTFSSLFQKRYGYDPQTCVLAVSGFADLGSGCETDSITENIEIEPASVSPSVGQSQSFTVSGGYEYT
jgi:hypothetical protein